MSCYFSICNAITHCSRVFKVDTGEASNRELSGVKAIRRRCKHDTMGKMCKSRYVRFLKLLMCVEICSACRMNRSHKSKILEPIHTVMETDSVSNEQLLSSENLRRLAIVERECKKYDVEVKLQPRKDAIPHLIVDDVHKILFCAIPKVASSNWKRVFIDALNITINGSSKIRDVHAKNLLPDLRQYSPEEQDYRLKNYFKIIFVRHPFERLLSAYRNKLENRGIEWVKSTKHTIDSYGNHIQTDEMVMRVRSAITSTKANNTISFSGFVDTLTDPGYRITHYNTHWKQYHNLCHPCYVRYDFIGKLETFAEDLEAVNEKTGLQFGKYFGRTDRTTVPSISANYYKTLRPGKLNKLIDMYDVDLAMYDYGG